MDRLSLIEFPADDLTRAQRFWADLLGVDLGDRSPEEGTRVQTHSGGAPHRFSLPYFHVDDLPAALKQLVELGGEIVHPGDRFAVCRDSEGNPFGLTG
jgi:predicted enzyme related to lactoylglutathione lyase